MTLALIDGDILIYKAACAVEQEFRWPDGVWTYHADENKGIRLVKERLGAILEATEARTHLVCFSDAEKNFRKDVYPAYKSNRKDQRKPLILKALRDYCLLNMPTIDYPALEADDVMGILATSPDIMGEVIIVTIDKDLNQIPVTIYNPDTQEFSKPEHRDCDRLVLEQTLTGDTVDGYPGCPGVGPVGAQEILDNPHTWVEYEHVFKSGKRKGLVETKWKQGEPCTQWEAIVAAYEKEGLTEADALVQARCAYILQATNYNDDGEIKLWEPTNGS